MKTVQLENGEKALFMEGATTNLLLNSENPQNQQVILNKEYSSEFVLWIEGSGNVHVNGLVNGYATKEKPFRFKIYEDGYIGITVDGEVTRFQLEQGSIPTSFIQTCPHCTVTRIGSQLSISLPRDS